MASRQAIAMASQAAQCRAGGYGGNCGARGSRAAARSSSTRATGTCSTCSTDRQILYILCMQSLSQSYQIASNKFKRFKNETKCLKDIFISFLYHQEWLLENCFTRSFTLRQIRRRLAMQSPGFGRGTQWLWLAHADCMKLR